MNPDPLRPEDTDAEFQAALRRWKSNSVPMYRVEPLVPDDRLGFLLALACGFIAGVLVMWVLR